MYFLKEKETILIKERGKIMYSNRKEIGNRGEEATYRYLCQKGYKVIDRNYRSRIGEIDLVALDPRGVLIFVEVRSRTGVSHGAPEESVDYRKQNKLRMLAQHYMLVHPKLSENPCRFDVIAVYFEGVQSIQKINHIENAF